MGVICGAKSGVTFCSSVGSRSLPPCRYSTVCGGFGRLCRFAGKEAGGLLSDENSWGGGHWWGDEYHTVVSYGIVRFRIGLLNRLFPGPVAYRSFEERDFALAAEARVSELFSFTKK